MADTLLKLRYVELDKSASLKDVIETLSQKSKTGVVSETLIAGLTQNPELFKHGMLIVPIESEESLKSLLSAWNPKLSSQDVEPSTHLIDIEAGFQNSADDPALYQDLMRAFIDTHENDASLIQEAMESDGKDQAIGIAHTLATTAATVGAIALSDLARKMHDHISQDSAITDQGLLDRFKAAMSASISELRVLEKSHITPPPKPEPMPEIEASAPKEEPEAESEQLEERAMPWDPTPFSKEDVDALVLELRPLLAHGNTKALTLLERVKEVLGFKPIECHDLMRFIKDFEFFKAESLFEKLVEEIDKTA
jgi:HPt (histidine-containing phosphotransfer) domain-containing protein